MDLKQSNIGHQLYGQNDHLNTKLGSSLKAFKVSTVLKLGNVTYGPSRLCKNFQSNLGFVY